MLGVSAFALSGGPAPEESTGKAAPAAPTVSSSSSTTIVTTTTVPSVTTAAPTTTTTTIPEGFVPASSVGRPWGATAGISMFRGNPTRTWYGTGPIPRSEPVVRWTYPERPLCGRSTVGGETTTWCGTGWTGQPVVWERPDGVTEMIVGAYDHAVHFVDAATGLPTRAPFGTGDLVKGSVTLDPDGYPLLYVGSRDGRFRILALDREPVAEIWSMHAADVAGIWNDDWDSNPVVVDDVLYVGGENGWFFAVELHRSLDGEVGVGPEILFRMPGWTDELVRTVGRNVSVESSVAVFGRTVYVTNSGGRVFGVDMDRAVAGEDPVVFDFWTGDDTDATPVVDAEGMLYVAVEDERGTDRAAEVGQLLKLDPGRPDDPLVWGVAVPGVGDGDGGFWATPALGDGVIYAPTHTGRMLAVDSATGEILWEDEIGFHAWSSPALVDGVLVVGTCEPPGLRAYDVSVPDAPVRLWEVPAPSCIESTPAVWEGVVYVGSRDGYLRAYGRP